MQLIIRIQYVNGGMSFIPEKESAPSSEFDSVTGALGAF